MISWLIRRLTPAQGEGLTAPRRARAVTVGTTVGMGTNVFLAAVKFFTGILTGSVAITADAANNLSDAAGSLMALISVRLAQKPIDREHPYGHGRLEYIGSMGIGLLILLMAVELFRSAMESILHPELPAFSWWVLVILLLSVGVKLWQYLFYHRLGAAIDASTLQAAAKDSLSDCLATSAVAVSMVVGHLAKWPIDGWMGLVVALLVCRAGIGVCRDMLDNLLGGKPDQELGRQIIDLLMAYDGILGIHDLMMHDYGPGRCVASVHAEVSADQNIVEAHEIIDRAEQEISHKLNIPICIHMDPIVTGDPETDRARETMTTALRRMNPEYMLHDFRRVPGEKQINLIFDVVIPADLRDTQPITAELQASAQELDPRYRCVIHYDIDYYHA